MKSALLAILAAFSLLAMLLTVLAQPRDLNPERDLMRQKLEHAQSVLEGLSLENFEMIAAHAAKLSALSESRNWRAVDTPEYLEQSTLFRRNVAALLKAARAENLDGATLAYTKITYSCVECHKYLRGRKVASGAELKSQL